MIFNLSHHLGYLFLNLMRNKVGYISQEKRERNRERKAIAFTWKRESIENIKHNIEKLPEFFVDTLRRKGKV